MTNLALRVLAHSDSDAPAIRLDDRVVSYRELGDAARRMAAWLQAQGIGAGDRVGVMLGNIVEFPISYYGTLLAGAVVVPMNPMLMKDEVAHYLRNSGARLLLAASDAPGDPAAGAAVAGAEVVSVDGDFTSRLAEHEPAEPVARADSDVAVILHTSGTTGSPKGAALTHLNLRRNAEIFARDLLKLTDADTVMGCLPLFHTFGQTNAMNCAMYTGAQLCLLPRFDGAAALDTIAEHKISVFIGVPTMYSALIAAWTPSSDVSSLRLGVSGGAPLPVEVLTSFEQRFGCPIIEGYGLSETSPTACFNPSDGVRKPGSVGVPIDGVEVAIVDDAGAPVPDGERGEIAIRGHNVMAGYVGDAAATAEVLSADGWFRTGDIGIKDEDGYVFIVDRKKSLIIRGGYNVYPREIEEVLYAHPDVHEAAVIGIPDDRLGEEVGAAVVLTPGATATPDDIRAFTKQRVAAYKYPRHVWVLPELPKGPTGKILRREIAPPTAV